MNVFRIAAMTAALALSAAPSAYAGKRDRAQIEIQVDGKKMTVTKDGKVVSTPRILHRDDKLIVLDDDGESVILTMPASFRDLKDLAQMVGNGPQSGPRIGVRIREVEPALAAQLGLEPGYGVTVTEVLEDGPAAKGGMQRYDVIMEVGGKTVEALGDLRTVLSEVSEGERLEVMVLRKGRRVTLDLLPTRGPVGNTTLFNLEGWPHLPVHFLEDNIAVLGELGEDRTKLAAELEQKLRVMEERLHELEERLASEQDRD